MVVKTVLVLHNHKEACWNIEVLSLLLIIYDMILHINITITTKSHYWILTWYNKCLVFTDLKMQNISDTRNLEDKKKGVPVGYSLLSLEFKVANEVEKAACCWHL